MLEVGRIQKVHWLGKGLGPAEAVEGRCRRVAGCVSEICRQTRSSEGEQRRGLCCSCRVSLRSVAGALVEIDVDWALGTTRHSEGAGMSVEEVEEEKSDHNLVARSRASFEEVVRRWARLVVVEGMLEMSVA